MYGRAFGVIDRYERVPPSTGRFVLCHNGLLLQLDALCYVTAGCSFNWTLCVMLQRVAASTGHFVLCYSGLLL